MISVYLLLDLYLCLLSLSDLQDCSFPGQSENSVASNKPMHTVLLI